MGLSLLAPLFLAGLAAIAVPILVHLTARDRRDVLRFPSLKFLTRLPYRQAKRQRLRHKALFALRALAVSLLVLAFTRPFFDGGVAGAPGGGRETVIALDRSYSMAYGETWERALAAARDVVSGASPGSRLSLVTFAGEAAVEVVPSTDPEAVLQALERLTPGSGRTRYAPALRLADEMLLDSSLAEREVVLISDLQAAGWDRSPGVAATILSPGVELTVADTSPSSEAVNVLIAGAGVRQTPGDADVELTVTAQLSHRGPAAVDGLAVSLTVEAEGEATREATAIVDLPSADSQALARLGPIELPSGVARATLRLDDDPLPADNAFYITVRPDVAIPVLLIEAPGARPDASLYLRQALTVPRLGAATEVSSASQARAFDLRIKSATAVSAGDVATASVVVIHDSRLPVGAAGRALADHVTGGGGLWVILGSRSRLPDAEGEPWRRLLPGIWRESVDRLEGRGVGLAGIDYRHPVFEIFAGSGDGNLAAPRVFRYRPIDLDDSLADVAVVARSTDGAVALAERRVGDGRVLLWGSPFDNRWSDLPVQAVFLPFVHQVCRYLAGAETIDPWHQVGEALDLGVFAARVGVEASSGTAVVTSPSGKPWEVAMDTDAVIALDEAGFYEITLPGHESAVTVPVAVNVDPAESDMTKLDAEAFVAASTTAATADVASSPAGSLSREQRERRQGVWWFLLLAVLLLLAVESLWSNGVAARRERSGKGAV